MSVFVFMETSKLLKKIGGTALIAGALLAPMKNANADAYLFGNFGIGLEANSTPAIIVPSVPEYIRNVPAYPGDEVDYPFAPIKDSSLGLYNAGLMGDANVGIGIVEDNFNIKIGGGAKFGPGSSMVERNYLGAPGTDQRGEGTALTYYQLCSDIPFDLSLRLSYDFLNPKEEAATASLFIDYSANFLNNLRIETGWDRYNSLQADNEYNLGNVLVHEIKAGIHIPLFKPKFYTCNAGSFLELYGEANIPQIVSETQLGSDVGLNVKPNFGVGVKIGFEFDTLPRD